MKRQEDERIEACECGCGHDHKHDHEHEHEECGCGCGHDHEHEHKHEHEECGCGCGHDHDHEHEHEECGCGCGHDHDHEHKHEHEECSCGCGHDHAHKHEHEEQEEQVYSGKRYVYLVEGLDCANCGAKIERAVAQLDGVESANLNFTTKKMYVSGAVSKELDEKIQQVADTIEHGVSITREEKKAPVSKQPKISKWQEHKGEIVEIGAGILGLVLGAVLKEYSSLAGMICFLIAYLILGREVLWTAVRNIRKGQVFDENFLMGIATIGAFVIGEYAEAVGVMLFYRIGELFEEIAVAKSRSQILDAIDLRPDEVVRVVGEETERIPAGDAKQGDILLVRPGDRIPLDGIIIEGESRIDTSPITGESLPVVVGEGSHVMSGCMNTSGLLKIEVEHVLEESMVTRILDAVEHAAAGKPQMERFITKFSRIYTPVVVAIAAITAVVPSLVIGDWNHWVYTALTFLVISCPCALVLSVPLSFFSGIGVGSKLGILFKSGAAMEALQNVKAVVMDKTGTITQGQFQVQEVKSTTEGKEMELLEIAACCEMTSTHPIATSIVMAAQDRGISIRRPEKVEEVSGMGVHAILDGKDVYCGNRRLMQEYEITLPNEIQIGYGSEVYLAWDGVYQGHLRIADELKVDAKDSIAALKRQGLVPAMLTGDAQKSAMKVAQEVGIEEVYAKLLPENKVEVLEALRERYGSVMFVGDGMNDAPVLAGADVGAAMGSGSDAAIEAADVVFMTSSMEAIPQALDIAKQTNRIARQNIVFALVVKVAIMALGLLGFANMWMAVFADTGVALICIFNAMRLLYRKKK